MSTASPLLQVRNLEIRYSRRGPFNAAARQITAVRGASFDVQRGRICALVGESGCGKSSIARAIAGLVAPASGTVLYQGHDLNRLGQRELRQARRDIQCLFQDPLAALSPRLDIWHTLLEPLDLYRIGDRRTRRSHIEAVLERVDLQPDVLARYPHELSGGQRQRVALARALLAAPKAIVADEPMSSLDVSVQARMIALLRKLQQQTRFTMLLISHDLAAVQQLADDIAVMYLGEIVETGPAAAVYASPAHPYTRALFSAVPGWHRGQLETATLPQQETPAALTPTAGCVFHTRCAELMEPCSSKSPAEITLAAAAGGGHHKVRCHLWNR
jgi:oligopeptide/dipeptide ABC transporter ATP-binding protein